MEKLAPVKKLRNKTKFQPTVDGNRVLEKDLYKLSRYELLGLKSETSDVVYYVKYNGTLNMCRLIKSHFHLCNPVEGYVNPIPLCTVNKAAAVYVLPVSDEPRQKIDWFKVIKAFFTDLRNLFRKK